MTQVYEDQRQPVAYCSRKLQPAESNYDVHDKALLAIVYCFKEWRPYLEGTNKKFTVFSDHHKLIHFTTPEELTRRQARWSEMLSEYNFEINFTCHEIKFEINLMITEPSSGDRGKSHLKAYSDSSSV